MLYPRNRLSRMQRQPLAVHLACANTFEAKPIHWLWQGWLAAGKFHIFAGAPGTGKTSMMLSFAAIIANGGAYGEKWPDGSFCPAGHVIIYSAEDDIEDTLMARLLAIGLPIDNIHFVHATKEADGSLRRFDPATDFPFLVKPDNARGCGLLIIDPFISIMGGDANRNQVVRDSMAPIMEFAERFNYAVVGITHQNKGSKGKDVLDRVTGSIANTALARIVLFAAKIKSSTANGGQARSILMRAKSNIGPDSGGFVYHIDSFTQETHAGVILASRVCFEDEPLEGSANDLLRLAEGDEDTTSDPSRVDEAAYFLKNILAYGEMAVPLIQERAFAVNISAAALKRAKMKLRIKHRKQVGMGSSSPFLWSLPIEDSAYQPVNGMPLSSAPLWAASYSTPTPGFVAPVASVASGAPLETVAPVAPVESVESVVNHRNTEITESGFPIQDAESLLSAIQSGHPHLFASVPDPVLLHDKENIKVNTAFFNFIVSNCREQLLTYQNSDALSDDAYDELLIKINHDVINNAFGNYSSENWNAEKILYTKLLENTQWWSL